MYNKNEFYSLGQIESMDLDTISTNDLHDLRNKLQDAFYHTSVNAENNLKNRLGEMSRKVYVKIVERNMNKALSQVEKDFSRKS